MYNTQLTILRQALHQLHCDQKFHYVKAVQLLAQVNIWHVVHFCLEQVRIEKQEEITELAGIMRVKELAVWSVILRIAESGR